MIACPQCSSAADFWFASSIKIAKADRSFFDRSNAFIVTVGRDRVGATVTIASYFPPVSGPLENVKGLPSQFLSVRWGRWRHDRPVRVSDLGAFRCPSCLTTGRHLLRWPADAYFQVEFKGRKPWAPDRKTALKLVDYIQSAERIKGRDYTVGREHWATGRSEDPFLRRIPTHFLRAKARPDVTRKLRRLLGLSIR